MTEKERTAACPKCGTAVKARQAVCPRCDHILNPEAFSTEPPPENPFEPEETTFGGTPTEHAEEDDNEDMSRADTATSLGAPDVTARARFPVRAARRSGRRGATAWAQRAVELLGELEVADRVAVVSAALLFVSSLLPWSRSIRHGYALGVMTGGAVALVFGAVAIVGLFSRTGHVLHRLSKEMGFQIQLAASSLSFIWCLGLLYSWSVREHDLTRVLPATPSPSFGVFVALIACVGGLCSALMAYYADVERDAGR